VLPFVAASISIASRATGSNLGQATPKCFETIFYLVIGNALADGQTLRRAQARLYPPTGGEPILLRVKETAASVADIRHGEWIFVEIGRVVSNLPLGQVHGSTTLDEDRVKNYDSSVPLGFLKFEACSVNGYEFGIMYNLKDDKANDALRNLFIVVSADDARAMNVRLNIDLLNIQQPVTCKVITG
jgi:hypothetical protein